MSYGPSAYPAYTGDPHDPHRPPHQPPLTAHEIQLWSHQRVTEARHPREPTVQPIPSPGDLVAVRLRPWGPTIPAKVLAVQPIGELAHPDWAGGDVDPNLWVDDGLGHYKPKWDPWPEVDVETMPLTDAAGERLKLPYEFRSGQRVRCKEARVRGSCGWLWPGHPLDTPFDGRSGGS